MAGKISNIAPESGRSEGSKNGSLMGTESLVGKKLYDRSGKLMGRLQEIVIDTRTGCICHVIVSVGGILGLGARQHAVPWSAFSPDAASQRCIADVAHMYLTAVPIDKRRSWLERTDSTRLGSAIFSRRPDAFGAGD